MFINSIGTHALDSVNVMRHATPVLVENKDNARLSAASGGVKASVQVSSSLSSIEIERQIFEMTNEIRIEHGLSPVRYHATSAVAAKGHSADMIDNDYFTHKSRDGRTPAARMTDAGVYWVSTGENIGYIYDSRGSGTSADVEQLMDMWMKSPSHRANILNPEWQYLGVGVELSNDTMMATQEFYY